MPEPQAATARACEEVCPTCRELRDAIAPAVAEAGLPVSLDVVSRCAGLDLDVARAHVGYDTSTLVIEAFEDAADELLAKYLNGFDRADTWMRGLQASLEGVLAILAERPATAHLCFIAVREGDRNLLVVAEAQRRRVVQFLADEHARRCAEGEDLPHLQFELLAGALFQHFGRILRRGALFDGREALVAEMLRTAHVFECAAA